MYIFEQYCIYFSPLQVKNKPREGVRTPAFLLGPVGKVGNILYLYYIKLKSKVESFVDSHKQSGEFSSQLEEQASACKIDY
jgi:hypothetical protein